MGYAYPIDSKVVSNPNGTIDYDRASSSAQLRGLIKSMITNGVNMTESTNLQVIANGTNNTLTVKAGYVIIEGAIKYFENDVTVTLPTADVNNSRIDTVVARLNLNESVRDIVIDVVSGTASATPTEPTLTRTTNVYEVGLANILVGVGASAISQSEVTDTRLLNSRCGLATSIGKIDTETLFVQLTTDFDNWFESIKGKLGDDVAGGLQMQIDDIRDDMDNHLSALILSENGAHGLRYYNDTIEVNVDGKWKDALETSIAPQPVTNVTHDSKLIISNGEINPFNVNWVEPVDYDIHCAAYNVYKCVKDTVPTFYDFEYIGETTEKTWVFNDLESNNLNNTYILIASKSAKGDVQHSTKYMKNLASVKVLEFEVGSNLESTSWENISKIGEAGYAQQFFSVGDSKMIMIDNVAHKVQICAFNQDILSSGGVAPITFSMKDCYAAKKSQMNTSGSNSVGWTNSLVRKNIVPEVYEKLSLDLKTVIKEVTKKTKSGGSSSSMINTNDKLFLPAYVEITGDTTNSYYHKSEGTNYPLFTNDTSRVKNYNDTPVTYWTRSPNLGSNTAFFGAIRNDGTWFHGDSDYEQAVSFCFCV